MEPYDGCLKLLGEKNENFILNSIPIDIHFQVFQYWTISTGFRLQHDPHG